MIYNQAYSDPSEEIITLDSKLLVSLGSIQKEGEIEAEGEMETEMEDVTEMEGEGDSEMLRDLERVADGERVRVELLEGEGEKL